MTSDELEDLFIRSLDAPMTSAEKESFLSGLQGNPRLVKIIGDHKKIREAARASAPASFGHYFASKIVAKIENTGVVIDRQIFSFFKKYQLAAAGIVVALLILNTIFSDQLTIGSIFGLDSIPVATDEIVSFDFYNTLNNDL
jgi:hypothetical protein